MKWNWRKIGTGLKIALNIAIDLNEAKAINVKELGKVKTIRDVVEKNLPKTERATAEHVIL